MKKYNRTQNAKRNIFFGVLNRMITQLLPFCIRTVIIYTLGEHYLGVSGLFTSVLQVLNLSELGFGSAMVYSMYRPIAEEDTDKICALLNLYKKVYRIIGMAVFVFGFSVLPFIPRLVKAGYPEDINLYIIYVIYLFNTAISYLLYAYKGSLLSAHQRNDIENIISLIMSALQYGIQIVILILCKNYYLYIIIMPIVTVVTNLVRSKIVDRKYPQYTCRGVLEKSVLVDIVKRVSSLFGHQLAYTLINSADNIVISAYLGLTMVAVYNNYYLVLTAVISFISIIISSITAGIGNSMVIETVDKNKRDLKKFSLLMHWLVGWCSICLFCLYQPFIRLWMGKRMLLSVDTVFLLVFYFYISEIRRIINTFKNAAGMWWVDKFKPYVVVFADIILDIILVQLIGVNGVIIASIISVLFIYIPWETNVFFKYYFKESSAPYYWELLKKCTVFALSGVFTFIICNVVQNEGIYGLLLRAGICVIVPNTVLLILYHNTAEFKGLLDLLKGR